MLLTLRYTVANLSRALYNTLANLVSQFSLFGKLWDLVSRKGLLCVNLTTLLLEEAALSNTTVAILQLLSETAVFCISRIANFRLFPAAGVEE